MQSDARWLRRGRDDRRRHLPDPARAPDLRGHALRVRRLPDHAGLRRRHDRRSSTPTRTSNYWPEAQLQAGKFKPPVGLERLQSATRPDVRRARLPDLPACRTATSACSCGATFGEGLLAYQVGVFNGVLDSGSTTTTTSTPTTARTSPRGSSRSPFQDRGQRVARRTSGVGIAGTYGRPERAAPRASAPPPASRSSSATRRRRRRCGRGARSTATAAASRRRATGTAGPFGLLGEYVPRSEHAARPRAPRGRLASGRTNNAWQVAASWVLTGENASYQGVVPRSSFNARARTRGRLRARRALRRIDFDDDRSPVRGELRRPGDSGRRRRAGPSASTGT